MSSTSFDLLATSVAPPTDTGRCGLVRASGTGTLNDPFRMVLLLRHADWGDRSTRETAVPQTELMLATLHDQLAQIADVSSSANQSGALVHAVEVASVQAVQLNAYFSGAVVVGVKSQLAAASIGNVQAWRNINDEVVPLLTPTLFEVAGKSTSFLTSAIGIGFAVEKVQRIGVQLAPGEDVVFALACSQLSPATIASSRARQANVKIRLENLIQALPERPPLAAILKLPG